MMMTVEDGDPAAAELDIEEGYPSEQDGILAQAVFAGSSNRIGYHGTNSSAALSIITGGFRPSTDGMLGAGVYWSDDVAKARAYTNDGSILRVQVKVGKVKRIDRQGHPLQKTWHLTHHTAWLPAQAHLPAADRMVPSGLSENCTHEPSRLRVVGLSTDNGETWKAIHIGAGPEPGPEPEPEPEPEPACRRVRRGCLSHPLFYHRVGGIVAAVGGVALIAIGSLRISVDNSETTVCRDEYDDWEDSNGDDCKVFTRGRTCQGELGRVLDRSDAAFDVPVNAACCACMDGTTACPHPDPNTIDDPRWVRGNSTLLCGPFWSSFRASTFCVWLGVACILGGITLGSGRILSGNRRNDKEALLWAVCGSPFTFGLAMLFYYGTAVFARKDDLEDEDDYELLVRVGRFFFCIYIGPVSSYVFIEVIDEGSRGTLDFGPFFVAAVYIFFWGWAVMYVLFDM
jgi:hypothetical protein